MPPWGDRSHRKEILAVCTVEHESHAQVWVAVDDRLQLGVCPHITGLGGHVGQVGAQRVGQPVVGAAMVSIGGTG
jgi:hypothetical protein